RFADARSRRKSREGGASVLPTRGWGLFSSVGHDHARNNHFNANCQMTIARRLTILLALPLLALLSLGIVTRLELSTIETSSRFVAEKQISSLALLGQISRSFYELRVAVRSHLLAANPAEQAAARSAFDSTES